MKKALILILFSIVSLSSHSQTDFATGRRFIKVGNTLREAQRLDEAEEYINKGLAIVKINTGTDAKYWEAVGYEYLGMLYRLQEQNVESIRYFNRALDIYKNNGFGVSARALEILLGSVKEVEDVYGGIDIGARGVKLSVVALKFTTRGEYEYRIIKSETRNTEPSSGTIYAFNETAGAVKELVDSLINRGIPENRTFVVGSSGLNQALSNINSSKVDELSKILKSKVTNYNGDIPLISAEMEAKLVTSGVLPSRFLYNSTAIDIGSGNTKGGYFTSDKRFEPLVIPYGTTTMTSGITKFNKSNRPFADATKSFYDSEVKGIIQPELSRKTGFKNRKNAFLMGGIVYAMTTYLYPQKIKESFVEFTFEDVKKFKQLAVDNYDLLINPNLDALESDESLRKEAEKQIKNVKEKTFNQENIIAGATLLENIVADMEKAQPKKKYYFPRYGVVGWITGYVIKSVSDEIKNKKE